MLADNKKNSIGEAVDKLVKLDSIGMMIIMSNATVLLARQEMEEKRTRHQADHEPELVKKMADST